MRIRGLQRAGRRDIRPARILRQVIFARVMTGSLLLSGSRGIEAGREREIVFWIAVGHAKLG